jgi:BlaI family transcriptional regulator, penicillinase repressor
VSDTHQLTDLQLALMRVLWRGEATVQEITTALEPERRLALTTVATVLRRLERRGLVRHRTEGRQFVYAAKVAEPDVRRSMVAELTDGLFDGNPAALVSHLLTEGDIAPGDLARVKELVAAHERRARKENGNAR